MIWYVIVNNHIKKLFICEQLNGVDLERLKMTTYHDQDKWRETNSLKPYYGFYKLLEYFLVMYVDSVKSIRESSAIYLCGVWCDKIKKINEQADASDLTVNDKKKEQLMEKTLIQLIQIHPTNQIKGEKL